MDSSGGRLRDEPTRPTDRVTSIFISYRRGDSLGPVGRLSDRLRRRFGDYVLFVDTTSIEGGANFPVEIRETLSSSAVVLVVIGKRWLDVRDESGRRRLDNPDDWARVEAATALHGPGVLVIPVLVDGAAMPAKDELPPDLQELPDLNAVILRDSDWDADFERLCDLIGTVLRRRDAGAVGALSLGLLAAPPVALALAGARAIAPLYVPGWSVTVAVLAVTAAATAGYQGLAGSRLWLARLSRVARRPALGVSALASVVVLAFGYSAARPVKLTVESTLFADPCAYRVQPYQESFDKHKQGDDRLLDAAVAPCTTEFTGQYQRIRLRAGFWPRRGSATVEVRAVPGSIRAVMFPKTPGYRIETSDVAPGGIQTQKNDVPAAPHSTTLTIPDLGDITGFAYWITIQSAEDRVYLTATLSAGGGALGSDDTWVRFP